MQGGRIIERAVMRFASSGWLVCQDLWVSTVRNGRGRSSCLIKTNGLCLASSWPISSLTSKFLTFLAFSLPLVHNDNKSIIPLCGFLFYRPLSSWYESGGKLNSDCHYGLYLLQTLVQYLGNLFCACFLQYCQGYYSPRCLANMEKLGMSIDKTPAGSTVSRLTNDTETISEMFSWFCLALFRLSFYLCYQFFTLWWCWTFV